MPMPPPVAATVTPVVALEIDKQSALLLVLPKVVVVQIDKRLTLLVPPNVSGAAG